MNYLEKLKDYLIRRGAKKNMDDLLVIFAVGLIIVLAWNFFTQPGKMSSGYVEVEQSNEQVENVNISYEEKLENELTDMLSQIEGAGKVKVMIYLEGGSEVVPAYSSNNSSKVTEENDSSGGKRVTNENINQSNIVMTNENGQNKPFIVKELSPRISGVIVVAEGAGNPDVKYRLYEAVKTVLNLQQFKINIYPMTKTS